VTTFAVIGGGFGGISVALGLAQLAPDAEVTIFEASDRIGGKLATTRVGKTRVEAGADSFIVRDRTLLEALGRAGVASQLIEPQVFGGLVAIEGRLVPLPAGTVLGVPGSLRALATSPLTVSGKARAAAGLLSPRPLRGPDVSVGHWVTEQLGDEVLDRLVDPILAGTRAGDVNEMSLAAALPAVDAAARKQTPLLAALRAPRARPRFLTHRDGMSALAEVLASASGAKIRTSSPVESVEAHGAGYLVNTGSEAIKVDGIAVCLGAAPAAALIDDVAPEAAGLLREMRSASVAAVAFAWARAFELPEGSSGILIPSRQTETLSAATWWSRKWPHTGDDFVIRAFVGRAGHHDALDLDDEALASAALEDLKRYLPSLPPPDDLSVNRWPAGMPVYPVGHRDHVAKVDTALSRSPGLVVTSAAFLGSGIPDIYLQAIAAAARLLGGLTPARR
jgi:protoporphyrinogen/coproporphyrinogen III oxidase